MKISKWGNSLAIRVPAEVAKRLSLKAGDEISVSADSSHRLIVQRCMTREEAVEEIRRGSFRLPPDYRFSREEAHARR